MREKPLTIRLPSSGKKSALGVAIESDGLSFVESVAKSDGISLARFGDISFVSDAHDEKKREDEIKDALIRLAKKSSTKNLYVAIPDSTATFFELSLPETDPFLLQSLVEREVSRVAGSTAYLLQTETLYRDKSMTKVAVALIAERSITKMRELSKAAGFTVRHIGLATEAAAELAASNEIASIMVSVGDKETMVSLLSKGSLVLETDIRSGVDEWIMAIARHNGIDTTLAEESLFFEGIFRDGGEKIAPELRDYLRTVTEAIEKIFLYWHIDCRKERECKINGITLFGRGAGIPGITHYMEKNLKMHVKSADAFSRLPIPEGTVPDMTEAESFRYLTPLALSVRGLLEK